MRQGLGSILALVVVLTSASTGCKKKLSVESCKAQCVKIGGEHHDRCLLDNPKALCDEAKRTGDIDCNRTCEGLATGKVSTPNASTSAPAPAPPPLTFEGTEAGARALLAQFVAPGADVAALSKTLRPTSDDYKALFDAETASQIESAATPQWDSGRMVIGPKSGQTEVKLSSATVEDLKTHSAAGREFPGGYARVAPHLNAGVVLYRFSFVEPGHDLGMAFDGLAHVNGHWVIVPKPWRMLGPSTDDSASADPPPAEKAAHAGGAASVKKADAKHPATATARAGQPQVNGRLPPEVIQRVVRSRFGTFRQCYERGLAANPNLRGKVSTKFIIDRSGAVSTAQDSGSDLPDRSVVSCVVQSFAKLSFPAPEGGIVTVVYPITFEPGS